MLYGLRPADQQIISEFGFHDSYVEEELTREPGDMETRLTTTVQLSKRH